MLAMGIMIALQTPTPDMGRLETDARTATWTLTAPQARRVRVKTLDGRLDLPLRKDRKGVWRARKELPDGFGARWRFEVDGKPHGDAREVEVYEPHPDTLRNASVPKGELVDMGEFRSKIFPNTTRRWWLYTSYGTKKDAPVPSLWWTDGQWSRGNVVTLDNLVALKAIPPVAAIFVTPGTRDGEKEFSNRSFEYDSVTDDYPRMLREEIEPLVQRVQALRQDPAARVSLGASSGAVVAFKNAWFHPEWFGGVVSSIGSFVDLQPGPDGKSGAYTFSPMVRRADKKPIRVFMQEGKNDLSNWFGNWLLANRTLSETLTFKGYDHMYVEGEGFHNGKHMDNLLPVALRWMWRDLSPAP